MKPIRLVMSAFGSYAGHVEIDFTKVNHGIFLITGDTGAGKTTIYDAITYALYDKTSGGVRDGNMMRSQYALIDVATYVEFTFEYNGNIYSITRNPEYERESRRKKADGTVTSTKEVSRVSLILPNGMEFVGKKADTNKKIIEIIGLDSSQFAQVAMIAQGDFVKLLHASSDDRKIIFSKIFNTKIYWRIAEELKQRYKNVYVRLEDNRKEFNIAVDGIKIGDYEEFSELRDKLEEAVSYTEPNTSAVEAVLLQIIGKDTEINSGYQIRKNELQKEFNSVNGLIQSAEENNKLFKTLGVEQTNRINLERAREQVTQQEDMLSRAKRAERVSADELRYCEKKSAIEISDRKIIRLEKDIQSNSRYLQEEKEKIEKHKNCGDDLVNAEQQLKEEKYKLDILERLSENVVKLRRLEQEKLSAYEKSNQKNDIYRRNSSEYEKMYDEFINQQAGIIASELEDGRPCPVCGSFEHPRKAVVIGTSVTQVQLNSLKEKRDISEHNRDGALEGFQNKNSEYESELTFIEREGQKVIGTDFKADDAGLGCVADELLLSRTRLDVCSQRQRKLKQLVEEYQKNIEIYQKSEAELIKTKGAYENEKAARNQLELDIASAKETFNKSLADNGFSDISEYQLSKMMPDDMVHIENDIKNYRQKISENNAKLEMLIEQTKDKSVIDTAELIQTRNDIGVQQEKIDKIINNVFSNKRQNVDILEKIQELGDKRVVLKKEYETISALSKTANGNITGTAKIDFETFVLRQYFRQIISAANKRLLKMVNNQFKLVCRGMEDLREQGSSGLDIDIYSFATNSFRDVKTLSGGESFMAALSMALGLADIIQASAGVIHIDTMFIDEGFGSLDDESREQAIRILNDLAGDRRLVGIISHVTELKEQIDTKLVVSKGKNGSDVSWKL